MKSVQKLRVGIIGGGQLGRMMILEGKKMGIQFAVLDPDPQAPAVSLGDTHVMGDYHNREKIRELADISDVLTYEFEHIDGAFLKDLEEEGMVIYPSSRSLLIIQDKFRQNRYLKEKGLHLPRFLKVDSLQDLKEAGEKLGYPMMLKATTGGYDGKGNALILDPDGREGAFFDLKGEKDTLELMAEEYIQYHKEISVIAARGDGGAIALYPPSENQHEDSILKRTVVPADVSSEVQAKAEALAKDTIEVLEGMGVFTIEMFVTLEGEVLINEIAPRVHNSGHYTIEASETSQFEQHLRAILALPLGDTSLKRPYAGMINLLGRGKKNGSPEVLGVQEVLETKGAHLHFYEKKAVKFGRKMGHITVTGDSREAVNNSLDDLEGQVLIVPDQAHE
ncbi:5-(carboxyamino)imidazole ribonucleotide synthase [Isachenkonia alkalipeptolytica]|nr:5-(carboxyamino)imidazole ribonucleotide synthase [Isachenkonia alkalipeptolytica]